MSKNKVELNDAGVRELLKSDEMQTVLKEYASTIRERCGEGYEQDTYVGKTRANAAVKAETYSAKLDNSKNNTLLKAVRG